MNNEFSKIFEIAGHINRLQKDLVRETLAAYEPEVNEIIRFNCEDKARIEHALDRLLDAAFDENVLRLYKRLCRHYYFKDEHTAVGYVQAYREMWDEDSL